MTATLVGRDTELALVASFLARAAAEGGAFLFTGEPGVGKRGKAGTRRSWTSAVVRRR